MHYLKSEDIPAIVLAEGARFFCTPGKDAGAIYVRLLGYRTPAAAVTPKRIPPYYVHLEGNLWVGLEQDELDKNFIITADSFGHPMKPVSRGCVREVAEGVVDGVVEGVVDGVVEGDGLKGKSK